MLWLVDFDDVEFCCQYDLLMSLLVWDLVYIGQQEELWLLCGGDLGQFGFLLLVVEGFYDVFEYFCVSCVELLLLFLVWVWFYCVMVCFVVLDVFVVLFEDGDSFVFVMVISYENQYDEIMLQVLNLWIGLLLLVVIFVLFVGWLRMVGMLVLVVGGLFVLGVDVVDELCLLDNECLVYVVDVFVFWIGWVLVINGEW